MFCTIHIIKNNQKEPKFKIKESYDVFRHFAPYSEEDAVKMLQNINQRNKEEYLYSDAQKTRTLAIGSPSYLQSTLSMQNAQKTSAERPLPRLSKTTKNSVVVKKL
jgi:hypothetical protein